MKCLTFLCLANVRPVVEAGDVVPGVGVAVVFHASLFVRPVHVGGFPGRPLEEIGWRPVIPSKPSWELLECDRTTQSHHSKRRTLALLASDDKIFPPD